MSEISLRDVDSNVVGKNGNPAQQLSPSQELNIALKECGFGLFHMILLFASLVGYIGGFCVSNTTPYILPVAECDLDMNLLQKGFLIGVPFIGMIISSILGGFLTDAFGRKRFLVYGFGGLFLCMLIAGSSQTYLLLLIAKFFEGILFAISFSPVMTLTSEFCHDGIRDRVMMFQSSFAAVAQIVIAVVAWGVLSQDWRISFFNDYIVLNSWNFYIFAMSLWSLLASLLYMIVPESPKYHLSQNEYGAARKVLIKMYRQNTGRPSESFPYADLWEKKLGKYERSQSVRSETLNSFKKHLIAGFYNLKPMFRRPLVYYLILICTMNFLTMILYNVLRLWFPQLSTIVEHYKNPGGGDDLCVMLDAYTSEQNVKALNVTGDAVCIATKSGTQTYINSLILGCVCLVPLLIIGVLVNWVGKKNLFLISGLISIGCTLGLRWTSSKGALVALFSSDVSITQAMMSLNQAFTVELFPTTTRTLAISMMMTSGRIGTLVGNVTFPVLLNMGCVVPFYTLAGLMICVTFMAFFLPKKA